MEFLEQIFIITELFIRNERKKFAFELKNQFWVNVECFFLLKFLLFYVCYFNDDFYKHIQGR